MNVFLEIIKNFNKPQNATNEKAGAKARELLQNISHFARILRICWWMNEILNGFSMHLYILCHLINEDFIQRFSSWLKFSPKRKGRCLMKNYRNLGNKFWFKVFIKGQPILHVDVSWLYFKTTFIFKMIFLSWIQSDVLLVNFLF